MAESFRPVGKDAHYPGPARRAPADRCWVLWPLLASLLLSACGSAPTRPDAAPGRSRTDVAPADPQLANAVLIRALGLVGTPYRWGGNSPQSGFDCSGLVAYVFRDAAGLSLPRSTRELAALSSAEPSRQRLAPGDLVLFGGDDAVNHVGIYVGEGRFVHAPNEGGTVRLDPLDGPYWKDSYRGAKRLLR